MCQSNPTCAKTGPARSLFLGGESSNHSVADVIVDSDTKKKLFCFVGEEGKFGKFESSKSQSYQEGKECTVIFLPR